MEMSDIESLTKTYADARRALAKEVVTLSAAIARVRGGRLSTLRELASGLKAAEDELLRAVDENPQLFARPKSRVFHDTKVGFQKRPGAMSWDDGKAVVARIRKHLPKLAARLIRVTEAPIKAGLSTLSAKDLKRLGVEVGKDGDVAFVKPGDTDLDKIVAAYLGDEA